MRVDIRTYSSDGEKRLVFVTLKEANSMASAWQYMRHPGFPYRAITVAYFKIKKEKLFHGNKRDRDESEVVRKSIWARGADFVLNGIIKKLL